MSFLSVFYFFKIISKIEIKKKYLKIICIKYLFDTLNLPLWYFCYNVKSGPIKIEALIQSILPDDIGMLYLSECLLRMAPTLGTLAGVITEGPWVIGVTGAVGVVGVWGKLCGDVSNMFLDMVTLDTKLSCRNQKAK